MITISAKSHVQFSFVILREDLKKTVDTQVEKSRSIYEVLLLSSLNAHCSRPRLHKSERASDLGKGLPV